MLRGFPPDDTHIARVRTDRWPAMSAGLTWLPDDRPGSCLYRPHILEITQEMMGHYEVIWLVVVAWRMQGPEPRRLAG